MSAAAHFEAGRLREAIAALHVGAESPTGFVADARHEAAFAFLELAAKAGHPVAAVLAQ